MIEIQPRQHQIVVDVQELVVRPAQLADVRVRRDHAMRRVHRERAPVAPSAAEGGERFVHAVVLTVLVTVQNGLPALAVEGEQRLTAREMRDVRPRALGEGKHLVGGPVVVRDRRRHAEAVVAAVGLAGERDVAVAELDRRRHLIGKALRAARRRADVALRNAVRRIGRVLDVRHPGLAVVKRARRLDQTVGKQGRIFVKLRRGVREVDLHLAA